MVKAMVGIVVVNYNRPRETISCLKSILTCEGQEDIETIVVVDNHSRPKAYHELKKAIAKIPDPRVVLARASQNLGYASGCNIGIAYILNHTKADWIWILNNDTRIHPSALKELLHCIRRVDKKTGLLGTKLIDDDGRILAIGGKYIAAKAKGVHIGAGEPDEGQYDEYPPSEIDYIVGASMFVNRKFVEEIGLMEERYFLFYEEMDWALRGRERGWSIGYCPKAIVYHRESTTIKGKNPKKMKELIYFFSIRNKIGFTKRFYPQFLPLVYLRLLYQAAKEMVKGQGWRSNLILKALLMGKPPLNFLKKKNLSVEYIHHDEPDQA